jgi:hypothetical protein
MSQCENCWFGVEEELMCVVVVGTLLYCVLGVLGMRLWQLHWLRRYRVIVYKMQDHPTRWRTYWLPLFVAGEVYLLLGSSMLDLLVGPFLTSDAALNSALLVYVIVFTVLSLTFDAYMLVRCDREMRSHQV